MNNKSINIAFRIPATYAAELSDYANRSESLSQTARRLLLGLLEGDFSEVAEAPQAPISDDFGDRLEALEKKISGLNRLYLDNQEAIKSLSSDAYWSDYGDRITKLEMAIGGWDGKSASDNNELNRQSDRLHKLETMQAEHGKTLEKLAAIIHSQPETAILIEKKPRRKKADSIEVHRFSSG